MREPVLLEPIESRGPFRFSKISRLLDDLARNISNIAIVAEDVEP